MSFDGKLGRCFRVILVSREFFAGVKCRLKAMKLNLQLSKYYESETYICKKSFLLGNVHRVHSKNIWFNGLALLSYF